jgi:myo-inositol-1(or 4)-monophosphatase
MWEYERKIAEQACRSAGEILRRRFGRVHRIKKKGTIDLVTEADLEAEKAVLQIIQNSFPRDNILSEEAGQHAEGSPRTWLIDPLDGTTNFTHGFPFFAVSVALEVDGELTVGVVYDPLKNELFEGAKGSGARLNNEPIHVSRITQLGDSLLGTGFSYDVQEKPQRVMERFTRMVVRAQGVRRPGSAALDLCYLAAGRFDGFWEEGLHPWDTAGGAIIVREAGGKVTTFEGEAFSPYQKSIVAANPLIHDDLLSLLGP